MEPLVAGRVGDILGELFRTLVSKAEDIQPGEDRITCDGMTPQSSRSACALADVRA
eukprot:SAG31_NODE_17549_length_666_cov_2.123457_2_plen_55_part_01